MAKVKVENVRSGWHKPPCGIGLALILLIIGLFWLGKDMGWIATKISIWPVLLIVLALYWIIKAVWLKKSCW